ncbi:MAG: glycoside hydrolase family 13 protein [Clostridia bacterium]|nr:glycoside hydrolase family 13 protein [Clostridia bacterium]
MRLFHDSNDERYRCPLGSGACESSVKFRLLCDCKDDARVYLRLWWQNEEILVNMRPCSGGMFSSEITLPDQVGVMWYFFIVETGGERYYYGNAQDQLDGEGAMYTHEPPGYQLTVYDPEYKSPEWMRDCVIYQIMTDRFFCSKPLSERPTPYKGWLHDKWNDNVALSDGEACDFFGGDLKGIEHKLGYLKSLGVGAIYLNPIFRARSNHKYDTGDYMQIDPMFGNEPDFRSLCAKAGEMGIRVMLDGVFSHTGAISRYFNRDGSYDSVGAYQSVSSPYRDWYRFGDWPEDYECWWGFKTMPNLNELSPTLVDFLVDGEDSVSIHWIDAGSSGWRLDVADELPMEFLRRLRKRVKSSYPDAALLGEVWEDASNKLAYGEMRCYCLGDTLDSVMNYPLREMAIGFMLGDIDATRFARRYTHMKNAYAPQFFYSLMNLLGSHDKPRIIDVLSGEIDLEPARDKRRFRRLSKEKYELGRQRYIALWRFICSLPGMPCVYYADEAGQVGMADPFCRATYPWGEEDEGLVEAIAQINNERNSLYALRRGDIRLYAPQSGVLVCARFIKGGLDAFGEKANDAVCVCALNRSDKDVEISIAPDDVLTGGFTAAISPRSSVTVQLDMAVRRAG